MAKLLFRSNIGGDKIAEFPSKIPEYVLDSILEAEADVIQPKIEQYAEYMLQGEFSTGGTKKALKRYNPKYSKKYGERQLVLKFTGVRKGRKGKLDDRRNATIAFLNEYGTRKTPPRPFVQYAVEFGEKQAFDNAEKVFDEWLKKEKMI